MAAAVSTQSYSRLEHSLGLLALVSHFALDDTPARAAALLHDIGHLPLSHTFEGIAGLDHHDLGARRIEQLAPVLTAHCEDADEVLDTVFGRRRSAPVGAARRQPDAAAGPSRVLGAQR